MIYADWVASGRLYGPIEDALTHKAGPWVANTHSYSNMTGSFMTTAYEEAKAIIENHVRANEKDMLVMSGTGMTGALSRLLDILYLEKHDEKPVVFMTHMEHHSHQVAWLNENVDVVIVPPGKDLHFDMGNLKRRLEKYKDRAVKIGAFTAGSNVTGVITPVKELAQVMHEHNGLCFIDYAATAPYVEIDMNPADNKLAYLDAIYFSPHKFLGGPGSCGVLIFKEILYTGESSVPGGGNVTWTTPWGDYGITTNNDAKEDGGTPGFMQAIKAALAIRLKEEIGVDAITKRENELLSKAFDELENIEGVKIVGGKYNCDRIGVVSFNIEGLHYNALVRIMNDHFGVQIRGGWACASTYVHYLNDIDKDKSILLTEGIDSKNLTNKPGFARLSLHPTMTDEELDYIINAVKHIAENRAELIKDYQYNAKSNDYELDSKLKIDYMPMIEDLFVLK